MWLAAVIGVKFWAHHMYLLLFFCIVDVSQTFYLPINFP